MATLDDWQRPPPTARQRRIDVIIGLLVVGGALLNVMLSRGAEVFVWGVERSAAEQVAWAFAVSVPLIWRRSHPEAVLVVTAIVFIAGQVRSVQEIQFASGVIFASIYAAGAWGRDRGRARWLRIAVIGAMFGWLAIAWLIAADKVPSTSETTPLLYLMMYQVLTNVLVFGFAYLFGDIAWVAARRLHEVERQAEALRVANEAAEERAVFGERVRIARELHDVVAHHVSVMGIQASAARRAMDKNADTTRAALTSVEQSARTAVEELHRMLGALRTPNDPSPPVAAGIEQLDDLIDRVRDAGLTAEFAVYGDPAPLAASTSQTAYRIVQEAITNTMKHAHASTVDVRVRYLAKELEIDVADNGRGSIPGPRRSGGLGLLGMRERAAVHGGTVEAGPRTNGGFRVRARLPLGPRAAEAETVVS